MKTLKEYLGDINISTTLIETSILGDIEDTIENGEDAVKKIYYIPQVKDFKKCRMYGQRYETYYVDWNIDWWISQYNIDMSKFDYAFDEPEFRYPEEPEYDDDGNPYWYCLCKVYRKEEKGGGYSKKVAKRRAAFKMLANLLSYKINENYDDGL